MKKRIIYTTMTILWMLVIFLMSAQTAEVSGRESTAITERILNIFVDGATQETIDIVETIVRKLCHFLEYALLCLLCYKTLYSYGIKGKKTALCIIMTVVYAVSDEIHQYFVPGRACRVFDVFIDSLGAVFGYWIANILKREKSQ